MGHAILFLIYGLLRLLSLAVIVQAVLSWLVAFDVINTRNRLVYDIMRFLDAVVDPMLRPIRRVIPPIGGVDITPIILLLLIGAVWELVSWTLAPILLSLPMG